MREQRLVRDCKRLENIESYHKLQEDRIGVRRDVYQAGKKNQGGAAFNIISLDYLKSKEGSRLEQVDNDAKVRAMMRSRVLDQKNNGMYDILTGVSRPPLPVPHHARYNPISTAGANVVRTSSSRHSVQRS